MRESLNKGKVGKNGRKRETPDPKPSLRLQWQITFKLKRNIRYRFDLSYNTTRDNNRRVQRTYRGPPPD